MADEKAKREARAAYMREYRQRKKAEREALEAGAGIGSPDPLAEFLGALGQGVSGLLRQRGLEKEAGLLLAISRRLTEKSGEG